MSPIRPEKVCDPDRLLCPRCGEVFTRVHVGPGGAIVIKCDRKIPTGPNHRFRDVCGQHVYAVGSDGYAVVFAITREEYEYLVAAAGLQRPAVVLTTLGVLRRRDVEHVPERECTSCHRRRKTFDLYDGVCRWCREDGQPNRVQA